jgi:hypothetical protein
MQLLGLTRRGEVLEKEVQRRIVEKEGETN